MAKAYGQTRLVTYDSEIVTPQDDAILYQSVTANGVFNNFVMTAGGQDPTAINIPKSFAILGGRFIEIPRHFITIDLAVGTQVLVGQVYLQVDLSNTQEPCQIIAETASNESELTEMVQDNDLNFNDSGVYMLKLGTFAVDSQRVYNPSDPTSGDLPLESNIFLPINAAEETNKNTDKIRELQTTILSETKVMCGVSKTIQRVSVPANGASNQMTFDFSDDLPANATLVGCELQTTPTRAFTHSGINIVNNSISLYFINLYSRAYDLTGATFILFYNL